VVFPSGTPNGGRFASKPQPPAPAPVPRGGGAPATRSSPAGYYALPSNVVPRARWTDQGINLARLTSNGDNGRMGQVTRITIHHDALDNSSLRSEGDVIRRLNSVRQGHVSRRPDPFADIGYHFIIDPRGGIWEGRSLYYQGAHVKGQNENNMGVMVMGHFDRNRPTSAALASLESFIVAQMHRYNIPVSRVRTHMELASTECPGRNLQRSMLASRNRGGAIYSA
jgi:hypothetical protein